MRVGLGDIGVVRGTQAKDFRATWFFGFLQSFSLDSKTFKNSSKRNVDLGGEGFFGRVRGENGTVWAKGWAHFHSDRLSWAKINGFQKGVGIEGFWAIRRFGYKIRWG